MAVLVILAEGLMIIDMNLRDDVIWFMNLTEKSQFLLVDFILKSQLHSRT